MLSIARPAPVPDLSRFGVEPNPGPPVVPSSAAEEYEIMGIVGEGAFGVVLKAAVRAPPPSSALGDLDAQQGAAAAAAAAAPHAAGAASAAGVSTSANPASASGAGGSGGGGSTRREHFVALKKMLNHREGQGIPQDAYREIKILKELRHEHLVRLERVFTRPSRHEVDLVYEYAEHDLADLIKHNKLRAAQAAHQAAASGNAPGRLPASAQAAALAASGGPTDPRMLKSILQQLLSGLAFLHRSWCMHRDLKPANILVNEMGKVKIADFGLARVFQSPLRKLSDDGEVVTIWYRAPEVLLGSRHYTRAIDLFAVGAIFFELMCCTPLFPGTEVKAAANQPPPPPAAGATGAAGAAAAAAAAAAAQSRPFQEHQVREVFRVLGKPSLDSWPGFADCPHYGYVKHWPSKDYAFILQDKVSQYAPGASREARSLLAALLAYDPARRLTAEEALQHPYFTSEAPSPCLDVFVDVRGQRIAYPPRRISDVRASKRMRDHEAAGGTTTATAANGGGAAAAAGAAAATNGAPGNGAARSGQPPLQQPSAMQQQADVSGAQLPPSKVQRTDTMPRFSSAQR